MIVMEFSKVLFLLGICLFTGVIAVLITEIFNIWNNKKTNELLYELIKEEIKNGDKR